MPPHCSYVEPYDGGSVLLARDPEDLRFAPGTNRRTWLVCEALTDITGRLKNLIRVLEDDTMRLQLRAAVDGTGALPRDEDLEMLSPCIAYAAPLFAYARESLAGCMTEKRRRRIAADASSWRRDLDSTEILVWDRLVRLPKVSEPPLDIIRESNKPHTLFLVEPIELHWKHPDFPHVIPAPLLDGKEQEKLLGRLKKCRGKVMLVGAPNDEYDRTLDGWNKHVIQTTDPADGSEPQVLEYLWCNY
jgi:hypothetical protein